MEGKHKRYKFKQCVLSSGHCMLMIYQHMSGGISINNMLASLTTLFLPFPLLVVCTVPPRVTETDGEYGQYGKIVRNKYTLQWELRKRLVYESSFLEEEQKNKYTIINLNVK